MPFAKEEEIQCIKNWLPEDMDFISGMGLMATMLILPFSKFSFVAQIKITMLVDCKNVSHRVADICPSSGPRGFHGTMAVILLVVFLYQLENIDTGFD